MTECNHNSTTEARYSTSKIVNKDGKPCVLRGTQIEVYCLNTRCLRTVKIRYEWDSNPECPD